MDLIDCGGKLGGAFMLQFNWEQMTMTTGGQVAFIYEWDTGGDESEYTELRVTAQISRYYPAVIHLSNGDPGYPSEGGEVEDIEVSLPDGSTLDPIPDDLYKLLEERAAQEEICYDD